MVHNLLNRPRLLAPVLAVLGFVLVAATGADSTLDLGAIQAAEITNFTAPQETVLSSGQPTEGQLNALASAGVRHVINLRTAEEEVEFDEQQAVEALGMQYHAIPVAGAAGITAENSEALQSLLASLNGEPVLIHCATGNRVGGLIAVDSFARGAALDQAIAEGARWGMTSERLQEMVRESLAGESQP